YNTGIGYEAGGLNTTGNYNSCFGAEAGYYNQTGSSNSIFGYQAGKGVWGTSNSNNCFFGYQSGFSVTSGTGNVFLGFQAGYSETGSNKLYIDNSSTVNPLIYGDFDADWIKVNGDFDVSFLATLGGLDVNDNAVIDGTFKVGTGAIITRFSTDGTMAANSDSYVPTEKAVRTYVTASKDNLGNHTATQNIKLSGYYLSNDGGNEGVYVDTDGDVGIGTNAPGSHRLYVKSAGGGSVGSTGYFENTASNGIALSAANTSTDLTALISQQGTGNILRCDTYTGGWKPVFTVGNTGTLTAPYLASGTGTDLYMTSGGEIVKYSSSRKYKKDIAPLSVDMNKFMSLQPVSFKWNEMSASEGKADYGLIAEEVEKVDPDLAQYNEKGEIEGVDYQKINIMLLKVVQEQEKKIEELEKRMNKLERNN
ncbi:MAG: tail fiber domain-containing protein, partial [Candidatus Delongbacteria bacterium]|nr:tail fiber domain-containing protein [Candidatus Delongbacteria bacterium]